MNFLDKLVLPQSAEHQVLLHFLSAIVMYLFLPYLGIIVGGSILSLFYKSKAGIKSDSYYLRLAKDFIVYATLNRVAAIALGILPVFILMMFQAQLLHKLSVKSVSYLFISLFFLVPGIVALFFYRSDLETNVNESGKKQAKNISNTKGLWGVVCLIIGAFFVISGISLAIYPTEWKTAQNLWGVFFSTPIILRFFFFVAFSFTISSAFVLFMSFYWEGGNIDSKSEYGIFLKDKSLIVAVLASLLMPMFVVGYSVQVSASSLNGTFFFLTLVGIAAIFFAYHQIYAMLKTGDVLKSGAFFAAIFVVITSFISADQMSFSSSTKQQQLVLATAFETNLAEMKTASVEPGVRTGEEIFKQVCSSCHKFDQKLVGPPYKETLAKYNGDVNAIIKFITNPQKINPAYTAMPAQSLKPKEAKNIAKFILEEVKKY